MTSPSHPAHALAPRGVAGPDAGPRTRGTGEPPHPDAGPGRGVTARRPDARGDRDHRDGAGGAADARCDRDRDGAGGAADARGARAAGGAANARGGRDARDARGDRGDRDRAPKARGAGGAAAPSIAGSSPAPLRAPASAPGRAADGAPGAFVVVGASSGLGRATARALARHHRVIAAGRDVARTRAAVPGAAEVMRVDLAQLADVRRFAAELAAPGRAPIAGLVCNAGVQDAGTPAFTADGFEATFAVNHLAHFALVLAALPALAPGARVVLVGSGTIDPSEPMARRTGFRGARYTSARALASGEGDPTVSAAQRGRDRYATSKLCNLLAMRALARRLPAARVGVHAIDPGLMPGTGLARQLSWGRRFAWHTLLRAIVPLLPRGSTPRRSAGAIAWLLTAPALADTTGGYFDARRRALALPGDAGRTDLQDELYTASLALAGFASDPLAA